MTTQITLSAFIQGIENGYITEVFSIVVNTEKRVYGKTVKGQAFNPKHFELVYAVVP